MISLDHHVFGCGGIPKGRIVELIGPESSGKTSIALEFVADVQRAGGIAAYIDPEHALDPRYASKLGVDVDNLLISQPDYGEQALSILEALIKSGAIDIAVLDSVAALVPKAELEGDMGDSHMGLQARLMSQALRKLVGITEKQGIPIIFINQIREKIGVMFGSPETTTGGRALKFYASVRLDIRRVATIKDGDRAIGHTMKVKAIKNKVATPYRETTLDLYWPGESDIVGFDKMGDLITYGVGQAVVERSGAWYSFKTERIGQGLSNASAALRDNPEWAAKILKAIKEKK
jgi:recombination protein RecA